MNKNMKRSNILLIAGIIGIIGSILVCLSFVMNINSATNITKIFLIISSVLSITATIFTWATFGKGKKTYLIMACLTCVLTAIILVFASFLGIAHIFTLIHMTLILITYNGIKDGINA